MGWKEWLGFSRIRNVPLKNQTQTISAIRAFTQQEIRASNQTKMQYIQLAETTSLSPEQRMEYGYMPRRPVRRYGQKNAGNLAQNLLTSWTQAVSDRRQYMAVNMELKNYYISRVILKTMKDDVLNANHKGEVLQFSSENPQILKALEQFKRDHRLDDIISDMLYDLINNGEYSLRLEIDPFRVNGVLHVHDDLNQLGILALYDKGAPLNFLVYQHNEFTLMPAGEYVHFILGDERQRIRIQDAFDSDRQIDWSQVDPETRKTLPDFVRTGEPFFYGLVAKIRELHLLEQLIVALKLNILTRSKFVALRLPAAMPQEKVTEAILEMEEMLNSESGLDVDSQMITISDIMTQAGRWKVIPNFADEKGSVDAVDVREDPSVDDIIKSITDYRKMILATAGIPYSLVYGDDASGTGESGRAGEIRRFGRYARTLSGIQRAVIQGVKQILLAHLVNLNHNEFQVTAEDFDVSFINTMVDLSHLERMEYDDAKIQMLFSKIDLLDRFLDNEILATDINPPGWFEWLEESMTDLTGGIPLFKSHIKKTDQDGIPVDVAEYPDVELESPQYKALKSKMVGSVMDKFISLRQQKDLDKTEQDLESELDGIETNSELKDDILKSIASHFASSRAKSKNSSNNGNGKDQ